MTVQRSPMPTTVGTLSQLATITTSQTWVHPTARPGNPKFVLIYMLGGGGGGGGGSCRLSSVSADQNDGGSGGGGAASGNAIGLWITAGLAVTIGAGGAGAPATTTGRVAQPGSAGGSTQLTNNTNLTGAVATGGGGGNAGVNGGTTTANGGTGGSSGGGRGTDIGGAGGVSQAAANGTGYASYQYDFPNVYSLVTQPWLTSAGGGGGGGGGTSLNGAFTVDSTVTSGGVGLLGTGGAGSPSISGAGLTSAAGGNATGYASGGGAAGACISTTATGGVGKGGDGSPGICYIYYDL